MFPGVSSQKMHSSEVTLRRGERWQEYFAVPVVGHRGNLQPPRISQMSPRESWEMRASFSASSARTLASSPSLIFIRVCFPPGNSCQSIQPAQLLPVGTGPKPTCPPSSGRTGAAVVLAQGGGSGVGGEAREERPSLISLCYPVFDQSTHQWRGERK